MDLSNGCQNGVYRRADAGWTLGAGAAPLASRIPVLATESFSGQDICEEIFADGLNNVPAVDDGLEVDVCHDVS